MTHQDTAYVIRPFSVRELRQMVALADQKIPINDIAMRFGREPKVVRRALATLKKHRLAERKKKRQINKEAVWDAYCSGMTYGQIALHMGIKYHQVRLVVHKLVDVRGDPRTRLRDHPDLYGRLTMKEQIKVRRWFLEGAAAFGKAPEMLISFLSTAFQWRLLDLRPEEAPTMDGAEE